MYNICLCKNHNHIKIGLSFPLLPKKKKKIAFRSLLSYFIYIIELSVVERLLALIEFDAINQREKKEKKRKIIYFSLWLERGFRYYFNVRLLKRNL